MNGNEHYLKIYLGQRCIATLTLDDEQLCWRYETSWQGTGYAVSPHLPLNEKIPPRNVQLFLRNLLPEGNILDELLHHFRLSKYNTFGLIRILGEDLTGALLITPSTQELNNKATFRNITHEEMTQRLVNREKHGLIVWDGKPRLSVAGIQEKINVLVNEKQQLGFGEGALCSTHILKFEKQNSHYLVLNEYITMQLAKACGLPVANTSLLHFGKYPALLVERFDRKKISPDKVLRRHIIDGCQALNLSPEYKYERNFGSGKDVAHIRDGASLSALFAFANQCENPAIVKQQLLDWVLFNLIIYNADAHGKNISFYVNSTGLALAPFYDLINIKLYSEFDHDLAMALGDEFDINVINAYQLADFADNCQLKRSLVTKRLKLLANNVLKHLTLSEYFSAKTEGGKLFLSQYQLLVCERCKHLLSEADDITSTLI